MPLRCTCRVDMRTRQPSERRGYAWERFCAAVQVFRGAYKLQWGMRFAAYGQWLCIAARAGECLAAWRAEPKDPLRRPLYSLFRVAPCCAVPPQVCGMPGVTCPRPHALCRWHQYSHSETLNGAEGRRNRTERAAVPHRGQPTRQTATPGAGDVLPLRRRCKRPEPDPNVEVVIARLSFHARIATRLAAHIRSSAFPW